MAAMRPFGLGVLARSRHLVAAPWTELRHRRHLHLAPPFLLDSYTPRYLELSPEKIAAKRALAHEHLLNCNLCPRLCGVNRYETTGMCLIGEKAKVNVVAPHFGEGRSLNRTSALSS
jgi:putative pyruvate formate lyase activating enzyme